MNTQAQIKALFDSLRHQEQGNLLQELYVSYRADNTSEAPSPPTACPYCQSVFLIKYGHWKQTQRYKGKTCQKTFTRATGTSKYY